MRICCRILTDIKKNFIKVYVTLLLIAKFTLSIYMYLFTLSTCKYLWV